MKAQAWLWPLLAALSMAVGSAVFAHGVEGYSHARHALSLLGGTGAPGWRIANIGLFVLPGVLMMAHAIWLRGRLSANAGWALRLGVQTALLAAAGHALQGVLNLDLSQMPDDGPNRFHAVAWMLWWLSLTLSAGLLACAHGLPAALRIAAGSVMLAMPLLMLLVPALGLAAIGHRLGIVLWLAWSAWLALAISRGAASSPKSSATAGR